MSIQAARFNRPKILFTILALSALAISLLALVFASGPAQAQGSDSTPNTYADPQPCGPGADAASMEEPHEITSGHFLLFDAYWRDTTDEQSSNDKTGVLHTNLCPPELTTTTEVDDGEEITVTALTDSGLDIDEAIIHVLDTHKATVVSGAADDSEGAQISTAEYAKLGDYASAGEEVWWLRLDDPDTGTDSNPMDETSDLSLGFSTMRFTDQDWDDAPGDSPAFSYEFRLVRYPGINSGESPEFLAYKAPLDDDVQRQPVWDGAKAGVETLEMAPGQVEFLQWVFTKPGTYVISAQLVGYVHKPDTGETWKPISPNTTESSEVKRYTFQVGNELKEEEPPVFGFNLSVPENSPADTVVSDPISVFQAEKGELAYLLLGEGSDHFALITDTTTDPRTVQIVVAEGADLDYETRDTYNLILAVTDNLDHESNPDPTIDDVLAVRITLEDEAPSVTLSVSDTHPSLTDTVRIRATLREAPPDNALAWYERNENNDDWSEIRVGNDPYLWHVLTNVGPNVAVDEYFKVKMHWGTGSVWSNVVTVYWHGTRPSN